jgi:hypothetical protein
MFGYVKLPAFEIALHEFALFATGSDTAAGLENGADTANRMQVIERYKHFEIATLAPYLAACDAMCKYCLRHFFANSLYQRSRI